MYGGQPAPEKDFFAPSNMVDYFLLNHTADIGITVFGADLDHLYKNAGYAMFDLIVQANAAGIQDVFKVTAEGEDWPDLMVAWLRELLYLWSGKEQIVNAISIVTSPYTVSADIRCTPFDASRHSVRHDIKAVTYHRISVEQTAGGWKSTIIFDV
ncbi:MAG: archease [Desulfobacterales bacterium]